MEVEPAEPVKILVHAMMRGTASGVAAKVTGLKASCPWHGRGVAWVVSVCGKTGTTRDATAGHARAESLIDDAC